MHQLQLEVTYSFIADNSTESQRTFRLSVLSFAWHVASPAAGYGGAGRCAVAGTGAGADARAGAAGYGGAGRCAVFLYLFLFCLSAFHFTNRSGA